MIWSFADADSTQQLGALEMAEVLFSLSRRHGLPYSVLALRGDTAVASSERPGASPGGGLEERVAGELRQTDVFTRWGEPGRWVVFCPSTSTEGAKELSLRIVARAARAGVAVGSASFRERAHTLPDLIDEAWADLASTYGDEGGDGPRGAPASGVPRRAARFLRPSWRRRLGMWLKRGFDLAAVLLTAPLWAPLALLVAAAIKLSAPRAPVLFRQERTGQGGRRFEMLKFRTMVPDAERRKQELAHLNRLRWPDFKIENDPRITRIGRFLRRTSLDELPQLVNVLRGEMSLVGPRPTSFAPETYDAWHTARLDVPPGVTGLWQLEGRAHTEFDERLRLDLEYVRRQGFFYDLRLLLRTIPVVLTSRGGH